jgi:copper oxidase (laccase) domain-containing protein
MSWMTFPALTAQPLFAHRFTLRHPGIDVNGERAEVVQRLWSWHRDQANEMGFTTASLCIAEQVHGKEIAILDAAPLQPISGTDGMLTNTPGLLLGIYVADCCAVFLTDSHSGACGLLHSGKKGSELGITSRALQLMSEHFGSRSQDIHVQLSPCIRPPAYEIDFAAQVRQQAAAFGIPASQIHDEGTCTSSDTSRFYSYRLEKGRTGRMLALLGRQS